MPKRQKSVSVLTTTNSVSFYQMMNYRYLVRLQFAFVPSSNRYATITNLKWYNDCLGVPSEKRLLDSDTSLWKGSIFAKFLWPRTIDTISITFLCVNSGLSHVRILNVHSILTMHDANELRRWRGFWKGRIIGECTGQPVLPTYNLLRKSGKCWRDI